MSTVEDNDRIRNVVTCSCPSSSKILVPVLTAERVGAEQRDCAVRRGLLVPPEAKGRSAGSTRRDRQAAAPRFSRPSAEAGHRHRHASSTPCRGLRLLVGGENYGGGS